MESIILPNFFLGQESLNGNILNQAGYTQKPQNILELFYWHVFGCLGLQLYHQFILWFKFAFISLPSVNMEVLPFFSVLFMAIVLFPVTFGCTV
jgi:hypothetical protein